MLIATVTTQRSGSKFLGGCFLSGSVVSPFGEVFDPSSTAAGSFKVFLSHDRPDYHRESGYDILQRYFKTMEDIRSIVHIDIMFNQVEIPTTTWSPEPTFFIYSYLKWAQAVVIHLERDAEQTFLSSSYLQQVGGDAHNYNDTSIQQATGLTLDIDAYYKHRRFCLWHKCQLHDAMRGYPFFYHLKYDDLAKEASIPEELRSVIRTAAEQHNIPVNAEMIQFTKPRIYPSNVDYRIAFSNYHQLDQRIETMRQIEAGLSN